MEDTTKEKEIQEISLENIVLIHNVRHAHMWHQPSYDPEAIKNYKMEDLVSMAITIVDNILSGKDIFDNEPSVFVTDAGYEVQTGSTRTIAAKNLEIIINKNKAKFDELYTKEQLKEAYALEIGNFVIVAEELSDAEKRRENNVRSDQHWLATAMGYHKDMQNGSSLKDLAKKEGKSPAKIRDLVNLEDLSSKAKTLCSKGVIGERVAIHLSKLPKVDQKLVTDYIEEKKIEKITNPKHLMVVLESSYTILDSDYPFAAFEYKGKEFPHVSEEAWYYQINDGSLFIRHLSKNEKKSDLRLDIYCQMKQDEIFLQYPEAKLVNSVGKSMVINDTRKCMQAMPLIVKGHTLKFGCSDASCEVHTFKVDQKVVEFELTEKLFEKEIKATRAGLFSSISKSIHNSVQSSFTLMMVIMQMLYSKLNSKGKEDILLYISSYPDSEDDTKNIDIDIEKINEFEFSSFQFKSESGINTFSLSECETIISMMAARWLRDNPNRNLEKPLFVEFGLNINYDKNVSQDVLDTVANTMAKKSNKIATKSKKTTDVLNTLVHLLGVATTGLHKDFKLKCYIISRRHSYNYPQKAEMYFKKGVFELKYPNIDQEHLWSLSDIANSLGYPRSVTSNVTTQRRMLKLINRRINEFAPFIGEYSNPEYEKLATARNEKHYTAIAIREFAINQFSIMKDDLASGVKSYSLAQHILEGINKNFQGSLNKEMEIESQDEHHSLEDIVKNKKKKMPDVLFLDLADHWFPSNIIYPLLDTKEKEVVEKKEWKKTGEDKNEEVWKQVKQEEVAEEKGWMFRLCNSIDMLTTKAVSVVKISDPHGSVAGVGHYFGGRADHYRVVYNCQDEDTINYFSQKDYEYVFANDQEDWAPYSALITDKNNRTVTYDLIMASVSKCDSSFIIAYAFDGGKMMQQPWWQDLINNNPEFEDIIELNASIYAGNFMHLSDDGRKGMYIIDMDGQGYYAVISISNEWTQSTDEEE